VLADIQPCLPRSRLRSVRMLSAMLSSEDELPPRALP